MKTKFSKLLSLLLCLVMVVGMLPTTAFAASIDNCPGDCTHEAAIGTTHYDTINEAVNAAVNGDTISILKDAALTEQISFLNAGTYTILGNGHKLTYNAQKSFLWITQGVTVNLGDPDKPEESVLTLDGTHDDDNRTTPIISILSNGVLNMYDGIVICNNKTIGGTGASAIVAQSDGTLNMYGGIIRDNESSYMGNAIFGSNNATINIQGGTITKNTTAGTLGYAYGAVTVINNATLIMKNCTVSKNTTVVSEGSLGGGVFIWSTQKATIENCVISENSSGYLGGGICVLSGGLTLKNTTISGNAAAEAGGGIVALAACELTGVIVKDNHACIRGGGIFAQNASLTVDTTSAIYKNTADVEGDDVIVTYDTNSSTVSLPTVSEMQPQANDYCMRGWFDDSEENRYDPDIHAEEQTTLTRSGPVILSLKVPEQLTYTVTFEAAPEGYGSVDVSAVQNVPEGAEFTAVGNTLTLNGVSITATPTAQDAEFTYSFVEWTPDLVPVTEDTTYTAMFSRTPRQYTISWDIDGDGTVDDTTKVPYGEIPTHADGRKASDGRYTYTFIGWDPVITPVTGDATYTAQFFRKAISTDPSIPISYTLHYESNGGTTYPDETYPSGNVVDLDKVPSRDGYAFTGWYQDAELTTKISSIKMTSNKTVYAGWRVATVPDMLNGDHHFAYVVGYTDGTVKPNANITRAEVAAIFFRLLKDEIRDGNLTDRNSFVDVDNTMWFNKAVSTMASLGIIKGRSADSFAPYANITRAEFAAICARFDTGLTEGGSSFTDISGHWAEEEIERAVSLGWIRGYTDGTFRPDDYITRAEAMTLINRVLCRIPENESDLLEDMRTWPDNKPTDWFYLAVQEATNSHFYHDKGEVYETWTELTADPDWTRYQY